MVAQVPATTAATKTAAALRFLSADTATGIVAYAVASRHDASRTNIVSLDTQAGDTFCSCKPSECGRRCWHLSAVIESWADERARQGVAWLTDAQLVRHGTKAARMVETYQARVGRSLSSDRIALLAAREEWRRRSRLGLIERAARTAVPVPVAA